MLREDHAAYLPLVTNKESSNENEEDDDEFGVLLEEA